MSYTLIDLHYIKRDVDGLLFTKRSPEYQTYVDWYHSTNPASIPVDNPTLYELDEGSYKGKVVGFCKLSTAGKAKKAAYLTINKSRKRGHLISKLCQSVLQYATGKKDIDGATEAQVNGFLATHGAVLVPLQQNRHDAAKALIDVIVPDEYISQDDLDAIDELYATYEPQIDAIV